jgi:hypothetical protein
LAFIVLFINKLIIFIGDVYEALQSEIKPLHTRFHTHVGYTLIISKITKSSYTNKINAYKNKYTTI